MVGRLSVRLGQTLLVTWAILTLLFLLTRTLLNEQELLARFGGMPGGAAPTARQMQDARQQARHRLGFDIPLFYLSRQPYHPAQWLAARWHWNGTRNQYHRWLMQLGQGNLGESYRTQEPVAVLLGEALRHTVPLTLLAATLLVLLSGMLGVLLAAVRRPAPLLAALFALDTLPLFVVALLLLLLLASPDFLPIFPVYGLGSDDAEASSLTYVSYLVLPVASLVLTGIAEPTLQLATSLRHAMHQDYALTARAKGLSRSQTLWRHALRNAALPSLTLLTDLLPGLLAGSVIVELVFARPGMGRLLAEAAAARDYPVLLGGALVLAVVRQASLWLADGLQRLLDPRLRAAST